MTDGYKVDLGTPVLGYVVNELEKGRLEIEGETVYDGNGFPYYEVGAFSPGEISTDIPFIDVNATAVTSRDPRLSVIGKSFKLYDDDERGLPTSHDPILPRFDLINDEVKAKYRPSFIEVIDTDGLD